MRLRALVPAPRCTSIQAKVWASYVANRRWCPQRAQKSWESSESVVCLVTLD